MRKELLREAEKYVKQNKKRRLWRNIVRTMACIVVFCTTYALILPAITLEKMQCGMEEHTHTESCFQKVMQESNVFLACTYESLDVHVHDTDCYDSDKNLICGQADFVVHAHDGSCVDASGVLVCRIPEITEHEHTDSCYETEEAESAHVHEESCYLIERGVLICPKAETDGHTHGDSCFTQGQLLCTLTETEGHTHGTDCYDWLLTCELTEEEGYLHTDSCYELISELICQSEETASEDPMPVCEKEVVKLHSHDDECYETYQDENGEEQKRLICDELEVLAHVHGESCFVTETVEIDTEALTCTESDETHEHTDRCYGTWELTCTLTEHTHTEECTQGTAGQSIDAIPECDCGNTSEISDHADSCSRKTYFRTLADEKTAEELYSVWSNLPADAQTYILTYLEWNSYRYAEKLETLKTLIANEPFEIQAELDGRIFTVTGDIPENAELLVQDSEYEQETAYAFLNPNMWAEVHNYWVYDICIQVNEEAYQPEQPVSVTVYSPDFQVTEDEYFCVAHLDAENGTILDSCYVEVQNNTITFEATGFSPYLFYTVDKSIDGGERVWGTNWMRIKESGFATYWEQFMTSNDSDIAVMSTAREAEVVSDDQPSSQQIVNPGGTKSNVEDGITVSKTIAGTNLENVFDITLKVTTTTQIQEVFQEPDMAVVIVMDISNTMKENLGGKTKYEAAILAAEEFVDQFAANNQGASKIGYVAFNTNATQICAMQQCYTTDQAIAFKNTVRQNTSAIITNYGSDDHSRFTNMEAGLTMARDMLASTDNAHKYIIFLSDGLPTTYLQIGTTSYKGYEPYTTSGTKNADGVFYDRINGGYVGYGSNYSDKGAIRAQAVASGLRTNGVTIFAVGVGVDSFGAYHPSGKVYLNSTAYINDQLDRGGKLGAYVNEPRVSTIDNYVTSRSELAVGDITNDANGDVFKTWLRNSIASGYYYNSANTTELQNAYASIFAELTRLNIEASASLWTVDDPIPLANGNPETVEFIGLWTKPLPSELVLSGSLTGAYVENGENTAEFVAADQMINWDLKNSGYVTTGSDGNMQFIYTLRYRVRLQNENENPAFIEGGTYLTNGETILRYQTIIKQNGNVSISDQKTIEFPIPSVKGWLGELSFTKIDSLGQPLSGAEFTLTHDSAKCAQCRGDGCTSVSIHAFTAVSDEKGKVSFSRIPSGHIYALEETVVPDGYTPTGYVYMVQVAYDTVSVTVYDHNGEELTDSWNGTVVNNFTYELPETGGSGTHYYTTGGLLLMVGAILLYIQTSKRRKEEQSSF